MKVDFLDSLSGKGILSGEDSSGPGFKSSLAFEALLLLLYDYSSSRE
jgi:hypothetical protein